MRVPPLGPVQFRDTISDPFSREVGDLLLIIQPLCVLLCGPKIRNKDLAVFLYYYCPETVKYVQTAKKTHQNPLRELAGYAYMTVLRLHAVLNFILRALIVLVQPRKMSCYGWKLLTGTVKSMITTKCGSRGGGTGGPEPPPPPGKSQVIWVSIGKMQLDPPGKSWTPWKILDPLQKLTIWLQ